MKTDRQIILAGKILDLNDKINQDTKNKVDVNWEDHDNLRQMATILARQVASFSSPKEREEFIEKRLGSS